MTTATYHTSGLGQDAWGQSTHPGYTPPQQFGQQPFWQPQFGQQPFGQPPFGQQQFGQPQFVSQQPTGQQLLAILPALFTQQAQQMYALAQVCTQLASGSGYQMGMPQTGQRPYPMGV